MPAEQYLSLIHILFAVHRVQQVYLFFLFEKGQLIGRVQGNLLFIHHIHQFRN